MNALGDKTTFTVPNPTCHAVQHQPNDDSPAAERAQNDWSTIPYPPAWHLQTMRLNIRPYHMQDAPRLAQIADDADVAINMTERFPHPYTIADAESFITSASAALLATGSSQQQSSIPVVRHFAICLRVDQEALPEAAVSSHGEILIGGIGVDAQSDVYRRGAELGYWLGREHWGRGYATEAAQEVVEWLFDLDDGLTGTQDERLLRISAGVFGGNVRSIRVLERAGFVVEATMKDAVWKGGAVKDLILLALTRQQREMKAAVRTVQG